MSPFLKGCANLLFSRIAKQLRNNCGLKGALSAFDCDLGDSMETMSDKKIAVTTGSSSGIGIRALLRGGAGSA